MDYFSFKYNISSILRQYIIEGIPLASNTFNFILSLDFIFLKEKNFNRKKEKKKVKEKYYTFYDLYKMVF